MTLEEFNSKYVYTSDKEKYGFSDVWEIISPNSEGYYLGDCESYCLTLKYKVEGFSNLELYYCKYNGEGHCIGKLGEQWIDCGLQRFVATLHPLYTDIRKYWLIEIWSKRLYGRIFRWLNNYLKR